MDMASTIPQLRGLQMSDPRIKKTIIHPGKGSLTPFQDGTKLTFHYQTRKCDEERTVLDDSHTEQKPLELLSGKKFKLEVWETCLKSMRLDEVASFVVHAELLLNYPIVAKSLRNFRKGTKEVQHQSHCCGMGMQDLGYADLDAFVKKPEPLEFVFELTKVEEPGEYKKDAWALNEQEKEEAVPRLKAEGNALFKEKKYQEASDRYGEALGHLEHLILKEKPGEPEWVDLDKMKVPLLLNFSQCKLVMEDYYEVIEHTTEVLKRDTENVKAYFRRAKAHAAVWNLDEARKDFKSASDLDTSITKTVTRELQLINEREKQKEQEDRERLQGKMFT